MEQAKSFNKWIKWGLINLAIVALFGTMMRYKIAFEFPFFQQKNLLHAHSHFAFSGWISHFIYCGLAMIIIDHLGSAVRKKYKTLIISNLVMSFGMLFAFTAQGYKAISITCSTVTIFIAVIFTFIFIKDAKQLPADNPSKKWAIGGLLLNILSSIGPFYLAYILASKNMNHNLYLGSIYYYLHFQYSGWFFFGCMALAITLLPKQEYGSMHTYFKIFMGTSILTVFLSLLWTKLPLWIYIITVIATVIQLATWFHLLFKFRVYHKHMLEHIKPAWIAIFIYGAILALSIKFILQTISVIPSLSTLVFGFRPIVIAYLHLVLLGVYSLFIIGFGFYKGYFTPTKFAGFSAILFFIGVILNELFLGLQGMAAFTYTIIPKINELLLFAAVVLFTSATLLVFSQSFAAKK